MTPHRVTLQFNLICINLKFYWLPIRSSIDATSIASIKSDTPKKIGSLVASKKIPRVLLGPPLYAVKNFGEMPVKLLIFELQHRYLHIFGVAQNFQFNGRMTTGTE